MVTGETLVVDFGDYFAHKYSDEHLVRLLQFHKADKGPLLYMLNNQLGDERVEQVYKLCNRVWELKDAHEKRTNKRRQTRVALHKELFSIIEETLLLLNRIAERETQWILYPLFVVADELVRESLYMTRVLKLSQEYIEKCGRSVHRSFTLCLNDRNPVRRENRRIAVYMFMNLEFKVYHRLGNRDMVKNLIKVIKSRQENAEEPLVPCVQSLAAQYPAQLATYHYFMGEYYGCYENDYGSAADHLVKALGQCSARPEQHHQAQIARILVLLIPFAILSKRAYPRPEAIDAMLKTIGATKPTRSMEMVQKVYRDASRYFATGNLTAYRSLLQPPEQQVWFLRRGVYVAMLLIEELVLLRRVRLCHHYAGSPSILPLEMLCVGISPGQLDTRMLECALANLISKGYIRGYLSHGNQCMVVSKTGPFPALVRRPESQ
mgnify:FL=1